MAELIINGGRPLSGCVTVGGSKNAALPIIFATLITRGVSRIERVPDILDVRVAIELIRGFGARVTRIYDTLYVDTRKLVFREPDGNLISKIRASTYLLGASVARFGKCTVFDFGGCNFAKRPIDLHVNACRAFGAELSGNALVCGRLTPAEISFPKKSVGATANALVLASATEGESRISGHAKEPHILNLIEFLRSAGADISITDDEIRIVGGELRGGSVRVIGDMIEAGSYLALSLVTDGEVGVYGCPLSDMASYLGFISSVGADIEIKDERITVKRGARSDFAEICAEPYPAYPTDLQPVAAPVLATADGGVIRDLVFPERFGYLKKLSDFGVRYELGEGYAVIAPSSLTPATVEAPDLRGGFACLLTALGAFGESRIYRAEFLHRGYESLTKKLLALGANVKSIE